MEPATQQDSTFGQYVIDEKIAQGGMAEIFLGRATNPHGLERPVVIKRILPHIAASPEFVEMLVQEAKLVVQLSHGNIAQVYDLGRVGEDYFMVMEYVAGKSLSQIARRLRLTNERIPIPIALYIVSEIANGLDYMHNKVDSEGNPLSIVHRDISPQNIIISHSGTVKIIDFGIAKAATQTSTTDSGVVKGKFAYMSPEHAQGESLDFRTDIFSLGVILWELLTNQRLFKGKNNKETINRVKRCRVPSVSGYRDDVPKELEKILKKTMAKNRKNRYGNAHDFLLDLIRALVHHYSNFAPRELEDYLKDLFAEQWEEEKAAAETHASLEALTEIDDHDEATALADPKVLKLRLKELENYEVEEAKHSGPPTPTEEEAPVPVAPLEPPPPSRLAKAWQVLAPILARVGRFLKDHLPPQVLSRWVLAILVILALGYAASLAFHLIEQWTEAPVQTQRPSTPIKVPKPPPPSLPSGQLKITSKPAGARIYLDDRNTGLKTPATLKEVKANRAHQVGLYHDNYRYWERELTLSPKEVHHLQATLKLNYGALHILSEPPGAAVWIGKRKQGVTPLAFEKLKPGALLRIRVTQEGFVDWTRELKVFAGRTQRVRAMLKKPPPPSP